MNFKAFICITTLLLLALAMSGWSDSVIDNASLGKEEQVFGKALSESVLTVDGFRNFDIVNDNLCVISKPGDSGISVLDVYDISSRKRLWSIESPLQFNRINHGPRPSVEFVKLIQERKCDVSIYDLSGEHLFDKQSDNGSLFGSPSGEYFGQSYFEAYRASVFDRKGRILFTRDVTAPDFAALPFNDSIVIHSSARTIEMLSVPSGELLASFPPTDSSNSGGPSIIVSPYSSQAILNWPGRTQYIDSNLQVGWEDALGVDAGAFSMDGSVLAILHRTEGGKRGLSLYRAGTGELLWTREIDRSRDFWVGSSPRVRFSGDLILVPSRWGAFSAHWNIHGECATFVARINPETGDIVSTNIFTGLMAAYDAGDRVISVRYAPNEPPSQPSHQVVIQEWRHASAD